MKSKWLIKGIVVALAICCQLYGFFTVLVGNCTPVGIDGTGIITDGVNMNDAVKAVQNADGDIFVLGKTCVQRFKCDGSFSGGAYFDKNSLRQVNGSEYMSLCGENVVIFEPYDDKITVFDEGFNIIDTVNVAEEYSEKDFYNAYPDEAVTDNIKLTLFNKVKAGGETIELDAPRNFLTSRYSGFLILLGAILVLLYIFRKNIE